MHNVQYTVVTAKDGAAIPVVTCNLEESGKKGVVLICHGFGEHSGAYLEHSGRLWQGGYACVIHDQRGHGKPPEGSKRWHGLIPHYQCFLDDIASVTEFIKEKAPDTPIAIYGHSMGGNIVANALLKQPLGQDVPYYCAILESPWFELYEPLSPFMAGLIKVMHKVAPNYRHYRKLKHEDLSGDAEKKQGYSRDPYYHGFISMRMITGIQDGCAFALENADKLPIKTYLSYADDELVVSRQAILDFAAKAGEKVTLKEYASKHAIYNDVDRESYCLDLIAFLDSNLK